MSKVIFLFIDQTYSIYHAISAAISLSKLDQYSVEVLCTPRNRKLINSILSDFKISNILVKTIRPYWFFTLPHYFEIKLQFRKVLFWKYKKLLSAFDVICCTLYEDIELKKHFEETNLTKFVFFNHGAVNRSYSFDQKIKEFDLFTLSGNYEKELRGKLNQLSSNNHVVSGYLKYELLHKIQKKYIFENGKPTIVYNPHWDKKYSSFPSFGFHILDFFASTNKYNLIFTPHSVLMVRNKVYYLKLLKYRNKKNIHIDLGSEACNDLTYTKSADLYLGDASSQAWEFILIEKRPCLFIDNNNFKDNPDEVFLSWELGDVINDVSNLGGDLKKAFELFDNNYRTIQEQKLKEMFYQPSGISPSELVVESIIKLQKENGLN